MREPQSVNMIRLRRCVDLPNPTPAPSGTRTCDCCDQPCWLSQGSVELLALFPQISTLCEECADVVVAFFPPAVTAQVPHDAAEMQAAVDHLTSTGEQLAKRGRS